MKIVTFLALTLCVFAVAASPRKVSAGRSAVKDSAAAWRGMLVDSRDGRSYRTIRIGSQVWMAENLNFATGKSWCYENDSGNCAKWGRLYDWQTARSACPDGWHLPSDEEWWTLSTPFDAGGGNALKSLGMKGRNTSGFNALPGGNRAAGGDDFYSAGFEASFWSSSESNEAYVWFRYLRSDGKTLFRNRTDRAFALSVRCLMNESDESGLQVMVPP